MKKTKLTFKESRLIFGKALKISIKTKSPGSIVISLLGFPMAFLPSLTMLTYEKFANHVQTLSDTGQNYLTKTLMVFLLLSALYIVQLVFNSLVGYFARKDAISIRRYMKEKILRTTCDVRYKYIENYDNFKERIRFADTNAGQRVAGSMQTTIQWLQNIITFVSLIVVLLKVSVWIAVVLIAACIPAVILSYYQKDEEYRGKTLWLLESLMACTYFFEATWQDSIKEVRFFGLYPHLLKKLRHYNTIYIKKKNKLTRKHVFYNSLADILRNSIYIVILLITAARVFESPELGIGVFVLVFALAGSLQDYTSKIFITAAQFVSDIAYMKDFFYLDELDYEKRDKNAKPREHFAVDFKDVSFTYPNTEREIIHSLNVHIKEGEKVAIVGENGSGKTTFISLLCAMYEPDKGEILMGGENINKELSRTRRTISAVFQDFSRYEASIRDNIIIADGDKKVSDEELKTLCQKIGSWEFIEIQPKGLDEIVGTYSESGNNLSGGQWQKVAITRCAYRDEARIMVLDEPTAALDPIAEAELYRNFSELTGDRTTILISHRLGITTLVDRILVFDDGRIVEDGDHKTLLARGGLYAQMYRAQAQWYEN